ncbi:hypothetical protein HU200_020299 [Digitaria exilis]|uniref:Uncharacterized protein n=1 Tax=Digitaria exilis TaxID=1010633 RepID=A0A835F1L9_9POAL|nr:hypothetical protein HU200_020299 [Digitaria exilis]CAB3463781.1 unnamed protein product [Digitaria exilis]
MHGIRGVFGSPPQSAKPNLWRHHNFRGGEFSVLLHATGCGVRIHRLTFGDAAAGAAAEAGKQQKFDVAAAAASKALGDWCTVPKVVAIGPYHRYDGEHLKQAEEVKLVAVWHCMEKAGLEFRELYHAVVPVVAEIDARGLYDKDVMAGITEDAFLSMMFYCACFLVMYMVKKSGLPCNAELYDFFESTADSIAHDIMLLENQIPWPVVDVVMDKLKCFPLQKKFIARWKESCLQDRAGDEWHRVVWDEGYQPPHLLGLLRFYMVGGISSSSGDFALSELPDMGLARKWIILAKLSMPPLSLNDLRASQLVNMAALELCTTPNFFDDAAGIEDSAVCSYLLLLRMLMHREADVHELRKKGILQGAGLTDNQTLDLFTSLHSLRQGRCYAHVMVQIAAYKMVMPINFYAFIHKKKKTFLAWREGSLLTGTHPAALLSPPLSYVLMAMSGGARAQLKIQTELRSTQNSDRDELE